MTRFGTSFSRKRRGNWERLGGGNAITTPSVITTHALTWTRTHSYMHTTHSQTLVHAICTETTYIHTKQHTYMHVYMHSFSHKNKPSIR